MSDFNLQLLLPQLFHELMNYLGEHPVILMAIGVFLVLAVVGAWYVLSHHLEVLLVTMLSAAGFVSGIIVLYRGYQLELRDLMAIGTFLMVIFPIIYRQAVRVAESSAGDGAAALSKGMSKGMAKRASA